MLSLHTYPLQALLYPSSFARLRRPVMLAQRLTFMTSLQWIVINCWKDEFGLVGHGIVQLGCVARTLSPRFYSMDTMNSETSGSCVPYIIQSAPGYGRIYKDIHDRQDNVSCTDPASLSKHQAYLNLLHFLAVNRKTIIKSCSSSTIT